MSSASKTNKYCYTCAYFGGERRVQGSVVTRDNGETHVCKISARGNGNQSPSNFACVKYKQV